MMAHLNGYLDPLSPHQLKKKLSNLEHLLTKLSGPAYINNVFFSMTYHVKDPEQIFS